MNNPRCSVSVSCSDGGHATSGRDDGLCQRHRYRMETYGSYDPPPTPPCAESDDTCSGNSRRRRGRCDNHHRRAWKPTAEWLVRQLQRYAVDADDHWIWQGPASRDGYGRAGPVPAHRLFHEHRKGPIPAGCEVDHLCMVRSCVNPQHLEAVTGEENRRRYRVWLAAQQATQEGGDLFADAA